MIRFFLALVASTFLATLATAQTKVESKLAVLKAAYEKQEKAFDAMSNEYADLLKLERQKTALEAKIKTITDLDKATAERKKDMDEAQDVVTKATNDPSFAKKLPGFQRELNGAKAAYDAAKKAADDAKQELNDENGGDYARRLADLTSKYTTVNTKVEPVVKAYNAAKAALEAEQTTKDIGAKVADLDSKMDRILKLLENVKPDTSNAKALEEIQKGLEKILESPALKADGYWTTTADGKVEYVKVKK